MKNEFKQNHQFNQSVNLSYHKLGVINFYVKEIPTQRLTAVIIWIFFVPLIVLLMLLLSISIAICYMFQFISPLWSEIIAILKTKCCFQIRISLCSFNCSSLKKNLSLIMCDSLILNPSVYFGSQVSCIP